MRFFKILIVTLLAFSLFTGCVARDPKYITLEKKSSPYQYSNEVYKNVRYENDFYLEVFDNNMYKTYPVDASDTDILVSFFESLNNDSYVTEYDLTDLEVQYKLIVNFNKSDFSEKYVFNIYDNNNFLVADNQFILNDKIEKYVGSAEKFNKNDYII